MRAKHLVLKLTVTFSEFSSCSKTLIFSMCILMQCNHRINYSERCFSYIVSLKDDLTALITYSYFLSKCSNSCRYIYNRHILFNTCRHRKITCQCLKICGYFLIGTTLSSKWVSNFSFPPSDECGLSNSIWNKFVKVYEQVISDLSNIFCVYWICFYKPFIEYQCLFVSE